MRFYQYSATDSQGRAASGTIRAASADLARDALTKAGYRVDNVIDPGPQTAAQQARAAQADMALRAAVAPQPLRAAVAQPAIVPPRPVYQAPKPITINNVASAAPSPSSTGATTHKTRFGKDKDLFLLFTQMGQYYRAGVTPKTAMHDLANKTPDRYRESLVEAEQAVGEGRTISDVFERYPYLYSPDIIGTLRAGEVSGYVSEACEQIGDQKMLSHRLKKKLALMMIIAGCIVGGFPIVLSIVNGALQSMKDQDKANSSLPVAKTLMSDIGIEIWHGLPWMLPLFLGIAAGLIFWHSMPMRDLRHRLILGFPFLGGRARAESMARFTWALGMVSRGGTSPHQTFRLAAESVPNLLIRSQLLSSAEMMNESERLSTALRRSNVLPVEYAHIVETGETTGDVPRALSDVGRATEADFMGRDKTAAAMSSTMLYIGMAVVVVVMLAFLYKVLYGGMIDFIPNAD